MQERGEGRGRTFLDASCNFSRAQRFGAKWSFYNSSKRGERKGGGRQEHKEAESEVTPKIVSLGSSSNCCRCWGTDLTDPQDSGTWSQEIHCVPGRILGSGGSGEPPAARWFNKFQGKS